MEKEYPPSMKNEYEGRKANPITVNDSSVSLCNSYLVNISNDPAIPEKSANQNLIGTRYAKKGTRKRIFPPALSPPPSSPAKNTVSISIDSGRSELSMKGISTRSSNKGSTACPFLYAVDLSVLEYLGNFSVSIIIH